MENKYLKQEFQEKFQKELKRQFREHRKKQKLRQQDVANELGVSLDTYQRWEKPSRYLTDITYILSLFHKLNFSTAEIIDVLGLPPLTLGEIKAIYQDEDTLKSIKENGIRLAMRESCRHVDDFTLEKMIADLLKEYLKRSESRHGNPQCAI